MVTRGAKRDEGAHVSWRRPWRGGVGRRDVRRGRGRRRLREITRRTATDTLPARIRDNVERSGGGSRPHRINRGIVGGAERDARDRGRDTILAIVHEAVAAVRWMVLDTWGISGDGAFFGHAVPGTAWDTIHDILEGSGGGSGGGSSGASRGGSGIKAAARVAVPVAIRLRRSRRGRLCTRPNRV